jgi:hypothetical protein
MLQKKENFFIFSVVVSFTYKMIQKEKALRRNKKKWKRIRRSLKGVKNFTQEFLTFLYVKGMKWKKLSNLLYFFLHVDIVEMMLKMERKFLGKQSPNPRFNCRMRDFLIHFLYFFFYIKTDQTTINLGFSNFIFIPCCVEISSQHFILFYTIITVSNHNFLELK